MTFGPVGGGRSVSIWGHGGIYNGIVLPQGAKASITRMHLEKQEKEGRGKGGILIKAKKR